MQRHIPSPIEIRLLEETAKAETTNGSIRLREGEYQYALVKGIASFQLELTFPDVRDLIRRLYGEEHTQDLQFVRKIQTILKKMEKGNIVRILPKKSPWQLQRYGIMSFKFLDSDKNIVVLATDEETTHMLDALHATLSHRQRHHWNLLRILALIVLVSASYFLVALALFQPVVDPLLFVPALTISLICSLLLGKVLSQK